MSDNSNVPANLEASLCNLLPIIKHNKKCVFNKLENVTSNLEKSTPRDIVFYTLNKSEDAVATLNTRMAKGNPGLLIIGGDECEGIAAPHVFIPQQSFFAIQKNICDLFYPVDTIKKIIGITGTNGKTSVVHLISNLLVKNSLRVLTLGTLGVHINGKWVDSTGMTTPPYTYLRKVFFKHRDSFDFVAMELSSHGLEQDRLGDIKIDLGVWTNFTRDHIDYHVTMEKYFLAKEKIFQTLKFNANVVIPKWEREIIDRITPANMSRVKVVGEEVLQGVKLPQIFMTGFAKHNAIVSVYAAEYIANISSKDLQFLSMPPGRFEVFQHRQKTVVVDYAHTDDALINLFKLAKYYFDNKRLNLLFGCGGERDVGKRKRMGEVAEKYFDHIYLTSDNPRGEVPELILQDIAAGMRNPAFQDISRRVAIERALGELDEKSVLLIAGKGSEEYQEINGTKYKFNDMEVVKEILKNDQY